MVQLEDRLNKEKQRVRNEVLRFTQLILDIERRRYRGPHIERLKELLKNCQNALDEDLNARLDVATSHLPLHIASMRLSTMRNLIKELIDFMYLVVSRSERVPRELYYLLDTFLENHDVSTRYVLFVWDEMAVTTFEHILELNNMRNWFPIFFQKIDDKRFYFVQVISDFVEREASLDWPIVLHEMSHIVCYEKNTYSKYLPKTSILEALRTIHELRLPRQAQKKLYVSEYLADLLTTRAIGTVYGWRFLENYGTYHDILDPGRTHPAPGKRVKKILTEIRRQLKMPESANFLNKQFEPRKKEWETIPRRVAPELNVDPILRRILKEARKYSNYLLTYQQIKQSLLTSPWFQQLEEKAPKRNEVETDIQKFLVDLQEDLLKGIPLVLEPFVLYYIFTLDFTTYHKLLPILEPQGEEQEKHAQRIKELIADCIRLYYVQRQFLTLKTDKIVPKKP
jgi:hypothetical protein